MLNEIKMWKEPKASHLSDPSLRQCSLPSSGAVLDVTGGGQSEESQGAQAEQGGMHRCRLSVWTSDGQPAHSSFINTWTCFDNTTNSWRHATTASALLRRPLARVHGVSTRGRSRCGSASEARNLTNLKKKQQQQHKMSFLYSALHHTNTFLKTNFRWHNTSEPDMNNSSELEDN